MAVAQGTRVVSWLLGEAPTPGKGPLSQEPPGWPPLWDAPWKTSPPSPGPRAPLPLLPLGTNPPRKEAVGWLDF